MLMSDNRIEIDDTINDYYYYFFLIFVLYLFALDSKGSRGLKTKLEKKLKTTGMTRGLMHHFQRCYYYCSYIIIIIIIFVNTLGSKDTEG